MADIGEPHLIGLQRCANKRLDIPVVRNEPGTVLHHLWLGCLHAIDRRSRTDRQARERGHRAT